MPGEAIGLALQLLFQPALRPNRTEGQFGIGNFLQRSPVEHVGLRLQSGGGEQGEETQNGFFQHSTNVRNFLGKSGGWVIFANMKKWILLAAALLVP